LPQRIANAPSFATYEQTFEFTIPQAGRYALRVEGKVPASIRPEGVPNLPASDKTWELRTRIFMEAIDDAARASGRPIFLDYATDEGTLGMPADSRTVLTVGAAGRANQSQPYSATGPAMNLELLPKPNLLVADDDRLGPDGAVAYGTDLAAPFAAGLAGRSLARGLSRVEYWKALQGRPARVLRAP
jgi:subtilisin family serine protease